MSIDEKTKFIIAIRGYNITKIKTTDNCTDVIASDASNKKVLLRSIEPKGNEHVDVNDVRAMVQVIKCEGFESAILIGQKFRDSAVQEINKEKIQRVSNDYMPPYDAQNLYTAIFNCVDDQCKGKCGKVPVVKSDCQVKKGADPCNIRSLADNASFHFAQGWVGLLKNDLKLALALSR